METTDTPHDVQMTKARKVYFGANGARVWPQTASCWELPGNNKIKKFLTWFNRCTSAVRIQCRHNTGWETWCNTRELILNFQCEKQQNFVCTLAAQHVAVSVVSIRRRSHVVLFCFHVFKYRFALLQYEISDFDKTLEKVLMFNTVFNTSLTSMKKSYTFYFNFQVLKNTH